MRNIEGYVCVAAFDGGSNYPDRKILFGKNKGRGQESSEVLQTNDLTVYEEISAAEEGQRQLSKGDVFCSVRIAKLKMRIAEKEEELEELEESKSLAVIQVIPEFKEKVLLGPIVKGKPTFHPIPGAFLYDTDFQTYDSLKRALYLSREVNRQAQCGAPVASFLLEYV